VQEYLAEMETRLEAYLKELDQADQAEVPAMPPRRSAAELQAKIERLKTRQVKYQGYLKQMEASGESQLSLTDPDSRSMPNSPKAPVGYNVQTAGIVNTT
jgi:hypothetical protein